MAGIGFRLQKILRRQTYTAILQAYFYAAVISSGPLVLSIAALSAIGLAMAVFHSPEMPLFFSSVTFIYSTSMILTGSIQLVMVRCAADADYAGHREQVWPLLSRFMAVAVPAQAAFAGWFFFFCTGASDVFKVSCVFLSVQVGMMWMLSGLLTAMKSYKLVVGSFAAGYAASGTLAWLFFRYFGPDWLMAGFAAGHALLVVLLLACIRRETPDGGCDGKPMTFCSAMSSYRMVALCGLAYNIGIWADKFLFWWFGDGRVQVSGLLYAMPLHDQAVYLGFLSIIPGMAIFLLKFETEFSSHYALFFQDVLGKAPLERLEERRLGMVESLRREVLQLVKFQGSFTLVLVVLADRIMPALGLGALQTGVFQIVLIGSFLLVLFLTFLTVLFYLDERRSALACCLVFAGTNIAVTGASIYFGEQWYGVGYVAAAMAGLAISSRLAEGHLEDLLFVTFSSQPMYPELSGEEACSPE
ncbi:MAG: exopolysaccharide Pel transporter PelG [Verrucomicrobiae bacterium]